MSANGRDAFDAALIPGMRARLAEVYADFRAAERCVTAALAAPEAGGTIGAYHERDCPGCGSPAPVEAILSTHGFSLVTCPGCNLTYAREVLDEAADSARYKTSTIDAAWLRVRCAEPYVEIERARARYYLTRLSDVGGTGGSLLDIGCGTGTLLVEAKALGWRTLGIEPGAASADVARKRGLDVIEGYFPDDLPTDQRIFDVIAVLDVLEHFADPRAFLATIRGHLAPGGRLFIQVPNWDSLLVQLEGASSSTVCPGHWTYFTPSTLPELLAREGFRPLLVETVVSELDRISGYPLAQRDETLRRLRPDYRSREPGVITPSELHALGLGYKLIGVFTSA